MSLKDQLLKSGLANAKTARKATHEKRQDAKNPELQTAQQIAQHAIAEKTERDRELNRAQQEEKEKRAIAAQVIQLIETQRISRQGGEVAYQFTDAKKIKKIYVSAAQQQQLTLGHIAVVRLGDAYELVPTVVAEKIQLRDALPVVLLNTRQTTQEFGSTNSTANSDDPYANYQIPDDLMW